MKIGTKSGNFGSINFLNRFCSLSKFLIQGRVYQTMKDTENYLLSMLGKDCQTSDLRKQHKIFYALKGIGNLGRPSAALPLIMDCVMNAKHANISTAAIQSIRKMALSPDDRYSLLEILSDQDNELEKRIEVFRLLMQNPTKEEIIFATDVANDKQDVTQLRSFVNSYLKSAMKNKAPESIGFVFPNLIYVIVQNFFYCFSPTELLIFLNQFSRNTLNLVVSVVFKSSTLKRHLLHTGILILLIETASLMSIKSSLQATKIDG